MKYKKGFSFQEIAIILVAASLFAGVALGSYKWIYDDAEIKVLKLKADEIERSIRSLANIDLISPNSIELSELLEEFSEEGFIILEKENGIEISYNDKKVCLVLSDEINKKGSIYSEAC